MNDLMEETKEKELVFVKDGDEYVAVRFQEFKELVAELNNQPTWAENISWLSEQTGIKSPQHLKETLLYPFRQELENFVYYPESSGEPWRFNINPMKEWLDKNFKKVHK